MDVQTAESLLSSAEAAGPELRGINAKVVFQQFEQQHGDLLSALQCFIDHGRASEACRLASALTTFWMATKRLDEGSTWFDRVLELSVGDDAPRSRALYDAGYLAFWQGDDARSSSLQNRAVELGRRTNNPTVTALALRPTRSAVPSLTASASRQSVRAASTSERSAIRARPTMGSAAFEQARGGTRDDAVRCRRLCPHC